MLLIGARELGLRFFLKKIVLALGRNTYFGSAVVESETFLDHSGLENTVSGSNGAF